MTKMLHFWLSNRCIPFRYRDSDFDSDEKPKKVVEVLMISSTSGPGLLFPKVCMQHIALFFFSSTLNSPFSVFMHIMWSVHLPVIFFIFATCDLMD